VGGKGSGGWRRKSAEEHRQNGTYRPGRHAVREVRPVPVVGPLGPAPSGLAAEVAAEYEKLRVALGPRGVESDEPTVIIAAYAMVSMAKLLKRAGRGVPDDQDFNRVWRRCLAALTALRLTPAGRPQVLIEGARGPVVASDPLALHLAQRPAVPRTGAS
jgi:hypothetical protein